MSTPPVLGSGVTSEVGLRATRQAWAGTVAAGSARAARPRAHSRRRSRLPPDRSRAPHLLAARSQAGERVAHRRAVRGALQVGEEHVVAEAHPPAASTRSASCSRRAVRELAQNLARASPATRRRRPRRRTRSWRRLAGRIHGRLVRRGASQTNRVTLSARSSMPSRSTAAVVQLGGQPRGRSRAAELAVLGHRPHRLGRRRRAARARRRGRRSAQEARALGAGLRVRDDDPDHVLDRRLPGRDQAVVDRQHHLADDAHVPGVDRPARRAWPSPPPSSAFSIGTTAGRPCPSWTAMTVS